LSLAEDHAKRLGKTRRTIERSIKLADDLEAQQTKRLYELYIEEHPETKQGGAPGDKGGRRGKAPRIKNVKIPGLIPFAEDAKRLGKSRSTVEKNIKLADDLEAQQTKRLYELYIEEHPETEQGGAPGAGRGKGKRSLEERQNAVLPFAEDHAKRVGKSRTTVERSIKLADDLDEQAESESEALRRPERANWGRMSSLGRQTEVGLRMAPAASERVVGLCGHGTRLHGLDLTLPGLAGWKNEKCAFFHSPVSGVRLHGVRRTRRTRRPATGDRRPATGDPRPATGDRRPAPGGPGDRSSRRPAPGSTSTGYRIPDTGGPRNYVPLKMTTPSQSGANTGADRAYRI